MIPRTRTLATSAAVSAVVRMCAHATRTTATDQQHCRHLWWAAWLCCCWPSLRASRCPLGSRASQQRIHTTSNTNTNTFMRTSRLAGCGTVRVPQFVCGNKQKTWLSKFEHTYNHEHTNLLELISLNYIHWKCSTDTRTEIGPKFVTNRILYVLRTY